MFISFLQDHTNAPITVNSDYIVKLTGSYQSSNWHQNPAYLEIFKWAVEWSSFTENYKLSDSDYEKIVNQLLNI